MKLWFDENLPDRLLRKVEDFQEQGSGWTLIEIVNLMVNINRYASLQGALSTFVKLPQDIQNKKALVNVKNTDKYCFLWSIMAALHPVDDNSCATSSYPHYSSELKYERINFQMRLIDIPKFKKMNGLSINVYSIEKVKQGIRQL